MDEFGVLTQSYGIKPQGKSAPMASLKKPITASKPNHNSYNDNIFSGSESKNPSSSVFDMNPKNDFFNTGNGYADDDIFGGGFNSLGSKKSNAVHDLVGDFSSFGMEGPMGFVDLMTGSGGTVRSNNVTNSKASFPTDWSSSQYEDPFQVLESASHGSGMTLDPLEQLGRLGSSSQGTAFHSSSASGKNDDLDPFDVFVKPLPVKSSLSQTPSAPGSKPSPKLVKIPPPSSSPPPKLVKVPNADKVKHSFVSSIDELEKFAMSRAQDNTNKHPEACSTNSEVGASAATTFSATWKSSTKKVEGKSKHDREAGESKSESGMRYKEASNLSRARSEDNVESFFMGSRPNSASRSKAPRNKEAEDASRSNQQSENDLESFFNMGTRSSSAPRSRATNLGNAFDNLFQKGEKPEMAPKASSKTSSKHNKASPMINMFDDFSVFGGDDLSGEFQEVEGESEERRTARLKRHQRTQNCVAQAVADMNKRELETRREQEEKHKLAEILDGKIKQWAWGKEGNLRSLLSSLQNVLWADSGWRPVSLTDMITSVSVKKVYNRANLIVHPDKLQQKGASLEQKYIGEKVFDMLKEAWNKFSKEELS